MSLLLSRCVSVRKTLSHVATFVTTSQTLGRTYKAMSLGPRFLNRMIDSEKTRIERRQQAERMKPKKLTFSDTGKTLAFNRVFHENVNLVLNLNHVRDRLKSFPVHVTKVRVAPNFEHVYVFWTTTSLAAENIQELEKLLDTLAPDIRFEIQQYALMGSIPKVVFMKEDEIAVEKAFKNLTDAVEELDTLEAEGILDQQPDSGFEMKTDVLGIKRADIMQQICEKLEHAQATHRHPVPDPEHKTEPVLTSQ